MKAASVQKPVSAPMTLEIGPSALAQHPERRVRLSLTEAEAEKFGLGERWRKANSKWQARQSKTTQAETQLRDAMQSLQEKAQSERWSQRQLAARAGLSWGAYRRCRDGRCDSVIWLPKIQAALDNLARARH